MHIRSLLPLLVAGLAIPPLHAAEGRIPVWMPTVISQPGHYVVTRDITSPTGPVLDITADGVRLDLNGHTIHSTGTAQPVVRVGGAPGSQSGVVINSGKIQGGLHGVLYSPPADDGKPLSLADLTIAGAVETGVKAYGFAKIEAQGIIIIDTKVGFELQKVAPGGTVVSDSPSATIRDTAIRGGGGIHCTGVTCSIKDFAFEYDPPGAAPPTAAIRFSGATGGEAVGIVIVNNLPAGGIVPCTLEVLGSKGISIVDGRIHGPGAAAGDEHCVEIDAASRDFVVRDSVLTDCGGDGIRALGSNGVLKGNTIGGSGGNGIYAGGSDFIIDDGKISGNLGAGIWFETSNHVYRDNILRGNAQRGVNGPGAADATDGGGNFE